MATCIPRSLQTLLLTTVLSLATTVQAEGESRIRTESVHFSDDAKIKVVDGTITGGEQVDYLLRPAKGQSLSIGLSTHHASTHFNVLAPGGKVPLFDGSASGSQYEGIIPETGLYRVRVYMNDGDAHPEEQASYQLEMVLMGGSLSSSAKAEAATGDEHYDATGKVPCAQRIGQPELQCNFGVIRTGPGAATVVLFLPDQSRRIIFFEGGRATGSDASQTSAAGRFRATREEGRNTILVGEERYEIPDSVVSGQ